MRTIRIAIRRQQLYVAEAKPGATEKQFTSTEVRAGRSRPEWSPDSKWIAFLEGEEKKYGAYSMDHLALVPSDGSSAPTRLKAAEDLDRGVSSPRFSADGKSIQFLVTDDRSVYPMKANVSGGAAQRLLTPPIVIGNWNFNGGRAVVMSGGNTKANEIHVWEGNSLRQLTHQNDALFAELDLGVTEEVGFQSKDGTQVNGLLTYPVGYIKGTKVPLLLRIHGGPNSQDQHSFSLERQMFAANGYAVLAVNYRGSAGRGQKFSRSIFADWGNYEVQDLLAGVDHVIKMGVADPDRLGVGGWSYGGILTDYLIATDNRFKAATSGAGTAFTVAFLRHRSVHHSVRLRNWTTVESESVGDVPEDLVSVPACRSHSNADALPRRRTRLQCARRRVVSRCIRRFAVSGSTRN